MQEAISKTDHGRRYGWWVLHNGKRIAELSYVYWDGNAQFWHYYHLGWLDEMAEESLPPEVWPENKVEVQNKEFQDVILPAFTSMRRGYEHTVGLRAAFVPEEKFRKRSEWSIPPLSSFELEHEAKKVNDRR